MGRHLEGLHHVQIVSPTIEVGAPSMTVQSPSSHARTSVSLPTICRFATSDRFRDFWRSSETWREGDHFIPRGPAPTSYHPARKLNRRCSGPSTWKAANYHATTCTQELQA
jgi:hypothetical protein